MNGADITVNINSPGGDMFEGLVIYYGKNRIKSMISSVVQATERWFFLWDFLT